MPDIHDLFGIEIHPESECLSPEQKTKPIPTHKRSLSPIVIPSPKRNKTDEEKEKRPSTIKPVEPYIPKPKPGITLPNVTYPCKPNAQNSTPSNKVNQKKERPHLEGPNTIPTNAILIDMYRVLDKINQPLGQVIRAELYRQGVLY